MGRSRDGILIEMVCPPKYIKTVAEFYLFIARTFKQSKEGPGEESMDHNQFFTKGFDPYTVNSDLYDIECILLEAEDEMYAVLLII